MPLGRRAPARQRRAAWRSSINPYHLGFSIWETIVEEQGLEPRARSCAEDDDFGFVRNHLDAGAREELKLFRFKGPATGTLTVQEMDLPALHEALLAPKYDFGAPTVSASRVHVDGKLELVHEHATDGRGLDPERATQGAGIRRAGVAPAGDDWRRWITTIARSRSRCHRRPDAKLQSLIRTLGRASARLLRPR